MPVKATVCVLLTALSVMVMVPVRVPVAVGVKVTVILQFVPAATGEPTQVLVWAKSPLATMLLMVRAMLPVLLTVTLCELLLVPKSWSPKLRLADDKPTTGPVPVPVRATV
jgi:hypothetical protein